MVLVADLEVFVETAGRPVRAVVASLPGDVVHPDGAQRLTSFAHRPWPRWEWTLPDGTRIACELVVEHAARRRARPRPALRRASRCAGPGSPAPSPPPRPAAARRPRLPRDAPREPRVPLRARARRRRASPGGRTPACRRSTAPPTGSTSTRPTGTATSIYTDEAERGLDAVEDLAAPGVFSFDLASGPAAMVLVDRAGSPATRPRIADQIVAGEARRRAQFASVHARAADAYIVARTGRRRSRRALRPHHHRRLPVVRRLGPRHLHLAARPLPRDRPARRRPRDPLPVGRRGLARHAAQPVRRARRHPRVQLRRRRAVVRDRRRRLPRRRRHARRSRRCCARAIAAIVDGYRAGTRHGIRVDDDGLLACGEPGIQLTWMDAKVGDDVHHAAHRQAGRDPGAVDQRARHRRPRRRRRPRPRRVRPVLGPAAPPAPRRRSTPTTSRGAVDASCRPNQIFAIGGVPHPLLDRRRTRARRGRHRRARRCGRRPARARSPRATRATARATSAAPPSATAATTTARCGRGSPARSSRPGSACAATPPTPGATPAPASSTPLLARTELAGLDHLSEICDGDPPHRPVGCPFQAWSLAEAIRIDKLLG